MNVEKIAAITHELNRLITIAIGEDPQPHWADAPQRMRDDTHQMVQHTLANPDKTAEDDHNHWLANKRAAGWTFGPVKDEAAKTHPLMIPYSDLPHGQRLKNKALPAVILALSGL